MDYNAIFQTELLPYILAGCGVIITAFFGFIGVIVQGWSAKAKAKIDKEIEKIENDKQRQLAWDAKERLFDLVDTTVLEIEQTLKDTTGEILEDKKIDDGEVVDLGKQAFDRIWGQLTEDSKELLNAEVEDLQKYIVSKIEAAVKRLTE